MRPTVDLRTNTSLHFVDRRHRVTTIVSMMSHAAPSWAHGSDSVEFHDSAMTLLKNAIPFTIAALMPALRKLYQMIRGLM